MLNIYNILMQGLYIMAKSKSYIPKALIVDDNYNFREGYREYLTYQTDLDIVGEAQDGFEAIKKINKLKPDIVFMDISMPKMDGLTAAHLIKKKFPEIKIVIVTIHEKYIFKGIVDSLPVDGFINKSAISHELPKMLKKLDKYSNTIVE
ncbi:MAG: response regulator transcription factor [Melioribacter sp.]|nr:response regulator transcription factor [Melioribacter sp.]